jgi:hypothetical protein
MEEGKLDAVLKSCGFELTQSSCIITAIVPFSSPAL